eukprot:CAMPEP_0171197428 /NCGR_PEP_ID=MMETSP0790-20130122/22408_1 /TAXON_ID=2925 /ORGANISM="Alexandrium catenella, Strain OF101" /LENGTH=240 /DNA_ID=CAMNT_0011662673 /DNA_START=83 /DNA_END=805 /DNA_ORIENTATION=-
MADPRLGQLGERASLTATKGAKDVEAPPTRPKVTTGPIFLENPDGTITEAIPTNYREPKAASRATGSSRRSADGDSDSGLSEGAAATMYQEVDFLYSRHERVLMLLLLTQFCLEVLYLIVYVLHMQDGWSLLEFVAMYNTRANHRAIEMIFWVIFTIQVVYGTAYYIIAILAIYTKRPKQYQLLANFSIFGIAGLILLAYVDKFNLIIFFLHLLSYIYARFLQGLTASLVLLPPTPAAIA